MSKEKLAGSALFVVAALMGAAAFAQDAMPGKPGHGPFDFATLDADKDGKVTKAEVEAFRAAKVTAMDANNDGKISAEELAAPRIAAATDKINARSADMVAKMDSDGDGMLSAAELATRPGPEMMFDRIDADKDGAVTQEEIDAARQAMHEKHGKRGHGKDGHGKGGKHRPPMMDDMGGPETGDDPAN
ncbi:EF-hand domain-containing protein [Cypionkella sp.]|uniref:EF-hand domain-containing protein n=1 Tax=Cypionkella sp. TaxID=2811411 RepID=UPI002ABBEDF3|nr:EF-hand domain-containing protein [Cypionkella sp.]MDZ4395273.1 EF-hand domain-containing protein [Cypionkella sp.]